MMPKRRLAWLAVMENRCRLPNTSLPSISIGPSRKRSWASP